MSGVPKQLAPYVFDGSTPGPGRPPGSLSMRTLLRQMLNEGRLGDAGELWVAQWRKAVQDGDTAAAKFVVDNLEGLLTQKVEQMVMDSNILNNVAECVAELYGAENVQPFMMLLKSKSGVE